jgi:hypothetical protein
MRNRARDDRGRGRERAEYPDESWRGRSPGDWQGRNDWQGRSDWQGGHVPGQGAFPGQGHGRGSHGYGGFGHGPSWGEGQGARPWEQLEGSGGWRDDGDRSYRDGGPYRNPQQVGQGYGGRFEGQFRGGHGPDVDDREENLRRGFGLSPYGGYGQSSYGPASQSGWGGGSDYGRPGQQGRHGTVGGGGPSLHRGGRGPKGYQRSDERIREDICDAVIDAGIDASEVEVRVQTAQVTLTGTVDHKHDKRHIEDIAESVAGVKDVDNQIRVSAQFRSSAPQTGALGGLDRSASSDRDRDPKPNGGVVSPAGSGQGSGSNASR